MGRRDMSSTLRFSCSAAVAGALALSVFFSATVAAAAEAAYPERPVHIVVPWPAGGPNDAIARILSRSLGTALKQSVVVDNRPGGNGLVGAEAVTRATPDGYTILLVNSTPIAINVTPADPNGMVDTARLAPITLVGDIDFVFVTRPHLPVDSLKDYVTYARANPGKLKAGLPGVGSVPHFLTAQLIADEKLNVKIIPYQGTAATIKDLLGGHIDGHFETLGNVVPYLKDGSLKALAVANAKRSALTPDVPTTAEQGYAHLAASAWFALLAPAGTPPAVLQRLNDETVRILKSNDYREALFKIGASPRWSQLDETAAFIGTERVRWAAAVRKLDLQPKP